MLRRQFASMIHLAPRGWQFVGVLGALLACESARAPSPQSPPPGGVLGPSDGRAAAGAPALMPSSGGAASEPNGGIGGNAPEPAGGGASGIGGNDTGSGGAAGDGSSGGRSGASGQDAEPSSDDESRYALWLDHSPGSNASPASRHAPSE